MKLSSLLILASFLCPLLLPPTAGAATIKLTAEQKTSHLFHRLAFGPRPGEIEKIARLGDRGIERWIEEQLHPEKIDDTSLEKKLGELKSLSLSSSQLIHTYKKPEDVAMAMGIKAEDFKKNEDLKKEIRQKIGEDLLPEAIVRQQTAQRLIRAVESRRQLQEVLTDFWLNHFNIDISKGEEKWMLPEFEREVIRKNEFGKFSTFLKKTAQSPAMLYYLDNQASETEIDYISLEKWLKSGKKGAEPKLRKNGLNENYARELLELHSLGVEGGYTQSDVTELARILTGWGIDSLKENPTFKFHERVHDRGTKLFLGKQFPPGGGMEEGEKALDLIAHHPSTTRFIVTQLARYFVSDNPPQSLIDRLAHVWTENDGELLPVYRELFSSKEFWGQPAIRAKVKRPLQYTVSAIRALGGELDTKNDLPKFLANLGEEPYRCPQPTGYKDSADAWVNPGAMIGRLNFAIKLANNRIDGIYIVLPQMGKELKSASKLIHQTEKSLLHQNLSPSSEKVVLRQFQGETWTFAQNEIRPIHLTRAVALILGSPEFQRR